MKIIWGAVLLILIGLGGCALNLASPAQWNRDSRLSFLSDDALREVLYYASLAPNAHNAQMWKVLYRPGSRGFLLAFDEGRALSRVDPDNGEAYLSLGAFLENARQAALALGFDPQIQVYSEPSQNHVVAEFYLAGEGEGINPARLRRMTLRHADKREYLAEALPETMLSNLLRGREDHVRYYPSGSQEYAWLQKNAAAAMAVQAADSGKRLELADWLRFSNAEAEEKRDGIPAEQLGMKGLKKALYYAFINRERAGTEWFGKQAVPITAAQAEHNAGFFILTGRPDLSGLLRAGMELERFWLDAVDQSIALQPMSQILEEEPFQSEIQEKLGLAETPLLILRAGMVEEYGANIGVRRSLSSFVLPLE